MVRECTQSDRNRALLPGTYLTPAVKILTFSSLYPNNRQPSHGIFVENRLRQRLDDAFSFKLIDEDYAAMTDLLKHHPCFHDRTRLQMIQADGGNVELVDVTDDGLVTVSLKGACAGCPMSTMTLKNGIERLLKQEVPGVKQVINV